MKHRNGSTSVVTSPGKSPAVESNGRGFTAGELVPLVKSWLAKDRCGLSVEAFLLHPLSAVQLAAGVAATLNKITSGKRAQLIADIQRIEENYAPEIVVINQICAAAMNCRKRGLFRTNGSAKKGGKTR